MDNTNSSSVTDDQELAKVLETMNQAAAPVTSDDLATDAPVTDAPTIDTPSIETAPVVETPSFEATPTVPETPVMPAAPTAPVSTGSPELDAIKKTALEELRPLVDKLDLPADEKFDTLLLLIRSTDDRALVPAAHEAARAITDETKKAQALLDVIKEIDYFAGNGQQPA